MLVRILLFARLREICDAAEVELRLPENSTFADAKSELLSAWPELRSLVMYCRFAVDNRYVPDDTPVDPDREIALIPPVSGG